MAIQLFDVGSPNTGTGLPLNEAFTSIQNNLTDLQGQINLIGDAVTEAGSRTPYIVYVATDGDDDNNGHSFAEPFATLAAAIEEAWAIHEAEVNARVLIKVAPGNYTLSNLPYRVPAFTSIMGDALRAVFLYPATGEERNGFFKVDDAFYMWGLTFKGHQADSAKTGWVVQLDDEADNTARGASSLGAYITASPYFQNCSSITAEDDTGFAPSLSEGDTGGGILVDGNACAVNSPIRSITLDSFTQINLGGIGCLVKNDGYAQLVSFFGTFCEYHVLAQTGGQVNFTGGTTDFGKYGLVADGYSSAPVYTAKAYRDHYGVRRNEFTATISPANELVKPGLPLHGLLNDAPVTLKSASNKPLQPTLVPGQIYYVINTASTTFQVAATVGGAAIAISTDSEYTDTITVVNQGELSVLCKDFTSPRFGTKSRPGNGMLMFPALVFPRADELAGSADTKGVVNLVEQNDTTYTAIAELDTAPAEVGKHEYVANSGTVTVTRTGIFVDPDGNTIVTVPVEGLNTFSFTVSSIDYNHLTGITKFTAIDYLPTVLDEFYFTDCEFICTLSAYTVTSAEPINEFGNVVAEVDNPYGYRVNVFNATNGGLIYPIAQNAKLDFRRRSQISAPSHVFEYIGSGMNYNALPENGGVPKQQNAYQELNNGRVFLSWTNEKGDFGVSNRFLIDGTTGEVTISASSFNLSGLNQIGPFSRNGGLSTVGVPIKEASDNINLISSLGVSDSNTVPTQTAVATYVAQQLSGGIPNGAIVNNIAVFYGTSVPTLRIDSTPLQNGDLFYNSSTRVWLTYFDSQWRNDPLIFGDVAYFNRTTKPVQRGTGVPLVIGDRWYNPSTGVEGFFNGTYWVSPLRIWNHQATANISASGSLSVSALLNYTNSVLIESADSYNIVAITNDASNYWTHDVAIGPVHSTTPVTTTIATFSSASQIPNARVKQTTSPSLVYTSSTGGVIEIRWTKTGNPGLLYFTTALSYRNIL